MAPLPIPTLRHHSAAADHNCGGIYHRVCISLLGIRRGPRRELQPAGTWHWLQALYAEYTAVLCAALFLFILLYCGLDRNCSFLHRLVHPTGAVPPTSASGTSQPSVIRICLRLSSCVCCVCSGCSGCGHHTEAALLSCAFGRWKAGSAMRSIHLTKFSRAKRSVPTSDQPDSRAHFKW